MKSSTSRAELKVREEVADVVAGNQSRQGRAIVGGFYRFGRWELNVAEVRTPKVAICGCVLGVKDCQQQPVDVEVVPEKGAYQVGAVS
jgi:hypothetical protein